VEVAVGKQSLSGETASKSNIARYLKDGFQSEYVVAKSLQFVDDGDEDDDDDHHRHRLHPCHV
jgi:hypothetical protein